MKARFCGIPTAGAVVFFVLVAAPRMRALPVGPPIYAIDLLIVATWYFSLVRGSRIRRTPISPIILTYGAFVIISEATGMMVFQSLGAPIYMLCRVLLAFSLFFLVRRVVTGPWELQTVLKACVAGIGITAVIVILVSLPMTRTFAVKYVFSIGWLEPAGESVARRFSVLTGGMRGRSLVGVSNLSGAFAGMMWLLAIYLLRWPGLRGFWMGVAMVVTVLCPVAEGERV